MRTLLSQYVMNIAMGIDQFASTILGGHPDDTISQRLGRAKLSGGSKAVMISAAVVDFWAKVLFGERDHCVNSLRGKSDAREIWNWGGSRDMVKVDES